MSELLLNIIKMKLAKHEYLAESALKRLDEKEHDKHIKEIDRLRVEYNKMVKSYPQATP